VTVDSGQPAVRGGYALVTFNVPNESDAASTTKLEVYLPESQPMASVRTVPVPGWAAEVTRTKLPIPLESHGRRITEPVTRITWTATTEQARIAKDQLQMFRVSLGRLPDADQLVFKAVQTYSDGEVVRWIEEKSGSEEPATPAPVLELVAAEAGARAADGSSVREASGDGGLAISLGVAGAVAGLLGLGLGVVALRRGRRVRG
jgi:uncharacterized protein YcnI